MDNISGRDLLWSAHGYGGTAQKDHGSRHLKALFLLCSPHLNLDSLLIPHPLIITPTAHNISDQPIPLTTVRHSPHCDRLSLA